MSQTDHNPTLKQDEVTRVGLGLVLDKAAKLPDGQFEAVLSTDKIDAHGEHISVSGIQLIKDKTYRIYWNHQKWGEQLPIGTWVRIWKSGGKLLGRGQFDLEDEFAAKVYKKVQAGIIDEVSVGLRGELWDTTTDTWTKSTLTEVSVVSEGANPDAKVTNKSAELDFTEEEFQELEKAAVQTVDGSGDSVEKLKSTIDELKSRLDTVEKAQAAAAEDPTTLNKVTVRLAAKEVSKQADALNQITKVILRKG